MWKAKHMHAHLNAMAISKKTLSLPLVAFFTTIFLMLLSKVHSSTDSLSFTFDEFSKDDKNLIFQGDTDIISNNVLQLTPAQKKSVGRILYSEEVHLWEKSTNRLSTFETTINFKLTSPTPNNPADGFTFFIVPPESKIPDGSYGEYFGLFDPKTALDNTKNQVVAVEFDTYSNSFDPNHFHIGIDVNSIESVNTTKWDRQEGSLGNVRINYNSATQNLSVVSSYPGSQRYEVSYVVNLRTVLPEWVRVGLSASTGDQTQVHNIRSWYFTSTLIYTRAKKEDMYIASVV